MWWSCTCVLNKVLYPMVFFVLKILSGILIHFFIHKVPIHQAGCL